MKASVKKNPNAGKLMLRKHDGRIMPWCDTLIAKNPQDYVEWSKEKGASNAPIFVPRDETSLLTVPNETALAPSPPEKGVVLPSDTDPDNPADPAAEAEMAARLAATKAAARKRK
jgi:hypothetical protein